MNDIKLHTDEPDLASDFFNFRTFSQQLANFLLDEGTPTPYTIGLHGEWGSGKTSLIKRTYAELADRTKKENFEIVWFDAWEYERLDTVSALLYHIAIQYPAKNRKKFQKLSSYLRNTLNVIKPVAPEIREGIIPVEAIANVPYDNH